MEPDPMKWLICLFLTLFTPCAAMAQSAPHWVSPASPAPSDGDANDVDTSDFIAGGVHNMIWDVQIRLNTKGYDEYSREVTKVVSRVGLERAGNIRIDYDPAEQNLIVHGVYLIRHGVRQKVNNITFTDLRRESEVDYGILDGRLTHQANIPGLRVGDIVDVSWTRETLPSVFPQHLQYWWSTAPYKGFQVDQFRLLARPDRAITIKGPATPEVSVADGWKAYTWRHENAPAADFSEANGDWIHDYGGTQITTATDWATITSTIHDSYQPAALPADLAAIVDAFTGTKEERITQAFRLVQDDVRYMGIEIGTGSYLPRTPEKVWNRRFGDCKDKALLLVSMLARMGIKADVALVTLYDARELQHFAPSPYLFNHAIVRITDAETPYFLDPTDVMQGGIGNAVHVPDVQWALPVTHDSGLVSVPQANQPLPEFDVVTRYDFLETGPFAAELTVVSTYRGAIADERRYQYSHNTTAAHAETLAEWYADRYPGATPITQMYVADDIDTNTLSVHEHYGLTNEGLADHRKKFWMNPYATKQQFDELPEWQITAPYLITPRFNRHRVEITGMPHLRTSPPLLMETPFFRYTRSSKDIPGGIATEFEIQTLVKEVAPADATAYSEATEAHREKSDWRYNIQPAAPKVSQQRILGLPASVIIALCAFVCVLVLFSTAIRRGYCAQRDKYLKTA